MKYVIIGSALSGNKGAASMLEASIQTISKLDVKASFILFSLYPEEDSLLNSYKNLEIISTKPIKLALVVNSMALLHRLLPPIRSLIRKNKHIKALNECDFFLDQGGITFVDGRGVFLLYNIASILPALLLNKPVVKCSQAMGPFNSKLNRVAAKLILPKIEHIFARGQTTFEYLRSLDLKNFILAADLAFLLQASAENKNIAKKILKSVGFNSQVQNIGVYPSEVMRKRFEKKGINYADVMAEFIDIISNNERIIYIIPHSQRASHKRHNNDQPLCGEIYKKIQTKNTIYLKQPVNAQQLREIVGSMDINVAARFHAMVSSLATGVPVLVTSWSHKYQEVLDMFDIKDASIKSDHLNPRTLTEAFMKIEKNTEYYRIKINDNLSKVMKSSSVNVTSLVELGHKK